MMLSHANVYRANSTGGTTQPVKARSIPPTEETSRPVLTEGGTGDPSQAGITAASGTRLAIQWILVKGFRLYSFQLPKSQTDETRPTPHKRENLKLGAKQSARKFAGKVTGKFIGDNPAIDLNPAIDSVGPSNPTLHTPLGTEELSTTGSKHDGKQARRNRSTTGNPKIGRKP
ncbi:hypothetical protein YC2023_066317 [Brassica napus]